jgi:hypothetical protein
MRDIEEQLEALQEKDQPDFDRSKQFFNKSS